MTRINWGGSCLLVLALTGACLSEESEPAADDDLETEVEAEASCAASASTYTPYAGTSPSGPVASYPWRGYRTSYPGGAEDFRGYTLPATIECSNAKSSRSHLDVTAGCLKAVAVGSWSRAQIQSTTGGAFRALALGFSGSSTQPMKWTDQSVEYRFYYTGTSGAGVDPGFKAFARYRTENDLYVGSWRVDGVIQIKKKICGAYTTLAQVKKSGPSKGAWHKLRFDVKGTSLKLYLDGDLVLSAKDTTLSWGTAGIRTDAMTGAYLDDWKVQAPM